MKTKKILISLTFTGLLYALLVSFVYAPNNNYEAVQQKKWVAPASADKIVNPLKGDAEATKKGKKMYTQLCVICHGTKGKGDGIAGAALNPKPGNFTKEAFFNQTDGAIFWKIAEGNTPMAAYKDLLSKEERWQLINYLRTFKKQ